MKKRIALIGFGPHARRIYYPYLKTLIEKDADASLELVIDIELNRSHVENFLKDKALQPKNILFLETDSQLNPREIHPAAARALKKYKINRAIIATEPKAHKAYIAACIQLGIPVLTDKPITAPVDLINSADSAAQIYDDVKELSDMADAHPGARVLVQCQRRNHKGYIYAFQTLQSLIAEHAIPLTYISIHHSDGMWNMPDELFYRENHPYKYGYGKLMHSGYHFADLLTSLLKASSLAEGKSPDSIELFSQYTKAVDQQTMIGTKDYRHFFGDTIAGKFEKYSQDERLESFGEIDSYSQLQMKQDGHVLTTVQMSLIQSGFSQRGWPELPEDTYKSNGRIRHEYINIHVGPLASIQIHSYQSKQINEQSLSLYDVGGNNHFDIYIFRNSNLIGGKAFEKVQFGAEDLHQNSNQLYLGHNEQARHQTLDELMYGLPSNSELKSHLPTNRLLSEIYKNHVRQSAGKTPISSFGAKELL